MRKIQSIQFLALVFVFGFMFMQCSNNQNIQKAMEKEVGIINAQCPVNLDGLTRLDSCNALPGKVFRYNYTITSSAISSDSISNIMASQRPTMIQSIKGQATMEPYRKENVVFEYIYRNTSGEKLYTTTINADDYK